MIDHILDMHCHILPGVDDGCDSMEDSIESIKCAMAQGIDRIIVTPHYHPGRYMVPAVTLMERLEELKKECLRQELAVSIYPGQECYYYSELGDKLEAGEVLTLNQTRYVLLEFDPEVSYKKLYAGIRDIKDRGYKVVLAHFERYYCLEDMDHLMELKESRVFLQMNFDTLRIKDRLFHKNRYRELVREGIVDFLGSDCHGTRFRPYHVDQASMWLDKKVDEDIIDSMLYQNIRRLGIEL